VRIRYRFWVVAVAAAALLAGGSAATPALAAYTALPAHVYAPYYETYLAPNTPSISATAQQSGAKYFTLAFLQSTGKGSCALAWNDASIIGFRISPDATGRCCRCPMPSSR